MEHIKSLYESFPKRIKRQDEERINANSEWELLPRTLASTRELLYV